MSLNKTVTAPEIFLTFWPIQFKLSKEEFHQYISYTTERVSARSMQCVYTASDRNYLIQLHTSDTKTISLSDTLLNFPSCTSYKVQQGAWIFMKFPCFPLAIKNLMLPKVNYDFLKWSFIK